MRFAGDLLQLVARQSADAAWLFATKGVHLAVLNWLAADLPRALGNGHDAVVARVVALVAEQERSQLFDVKRHLRNDSPVHVSQVGGDQRGLARVAPEQLYDSDPLVGTTGGAQVVNHVDAARDSRGETDAVVGAIDIVVHCLGDGDYRHALVVQAGGIGKGVVAANDQQGIQIEEGQDIGLLLSATESGTAAASSRWGLRREVCKKVPPLRSMVRTSWRVKGRVLSSRLWGSSGLRLNSPPQPRRIPVTSQPASTARCTAALIAAFRPATSPPPVRMPTRFPSSSDK